MVRLPRVKFPLPSDKVKTGIAMTAGALVRTGTSPDDAFKDLFRAVQESNVLGDGKMFVDLIPKKRARAILEEYEIMRLDPTFNLHEFISRHFYEFSPHGRHMPGTETDIDMHIRELWSALLRRNRRPRGSLLTLPYGYIVPGGRFNEQFYWDSYFIMLGLATDDRWGDIERMMKNYAFMIRKYGFIPTANRSYFLSRSQPPFFAQMVRLLARHRGRRRTYSEYLPYLLAEYRCWMKGTNKLNEKTHHSFLRVLEMPDGSLLNRYYDNKPRPRPESLREDIETSNEAPDRDPEKLYLHLRAAAESGWDFSSRWFDNPYDIRTIHTADIVPVDLNCLLFILETTIAEGYRGLKQGVLARRFERYAAKRARAIQKYCWNADEGYYGDYNFHDDCLTASKSLAMVFPLYAGIATKEQADAVARMLERDFLKPGGLVTTLIENGQQWDAPNGWAPLEWVAVQGLKNYGFDELADEVTKRWMGRCELVYSSSHKLIEKYDVVGKSGLGGGGEYPLQDGFGWTNGVYEAFKARLETDALSPEQE